MKLRYLLPFALLGSLSWSASAETTIKILHLQKLPKAIAIWQDAAKEYEKAHPGVKVEFDYLENEAFKASCQPCSNPKIGRAAFTAGVEG